MNIKFPKGYTVDSVLAQVQSEYDATIDFVNTKRQLFNDRMDLYINTADSKNKVYVRLIRSVMETLLSLYYQDKIKVKFSPRHFEDTMQADNLQNLAEFDYGEMGLAEKKYQVQWDKFFYGVGIEMYDGWDVVSKKPKVRVVDPRTRVPSAYDVNYGYKYHGFEMNIAGFELNNPRFLNTDRVKTDAEIAKIREDLTEDKTFDQIAYDTALNATRNLNTDGTNNIAGNETYSIYYHYTVIGGEKYLIILGNNRSLLLAFEKVKAVRTEEKKDANKIPFPVVVRHYSPLRGDPYGISIPDILEDKQRMEQLFMNLNRIKAEHEARGDFFMYDGEAVQNINQLKIPSRGPKYIKADLSINPNPIVPIPRSQISQDAYNMPNVIKEQGQLDVGLDTRSMGISGGSSITATENQRVQKNANLKLVLGSRIDSRAERQFRDILWYRVYQQFFKMTDEKNILINKGAGRTPITVNKKDFVSKNDVDIEITTESEDKAKKEEERAGFNMLFQYILQNPSGSEYSKNIATRKLFVLNGTDSEEANVFIPQTVDEMSATMDLEFLNRNEEPIKPEMEQDHMTYIGIYQKALNTDAKYNAIELRKALFVKSGQQAKQQAAQQVQQQQGAEDGGNTQSQLTSNSIQKSNANTGEGLSI